MARGHLVFRFHVGPQAHYLGAMVIREVVYAELVAQVPGNKDLTSLCKTQEFDFRTHRPRCSISPNRHWLSIQNLTGNPLYNAAPGVERLLCINARIVSGRFP